MSTEIDNDCAGEPATLAELVRDPLIGLVMQSDGVDRHGVELLFERLARLRSRAVRRCDAAFPDVGFA